MSQWVGNFYRNFSRFALPFADATTEQLPMTRIFRLALFQITVGMMYVLFTGTLNRVMIHELGIAAALLGAMLALPVLLAPLRLLIGHRSDHHPSHLGWRRVPYLWMGTLFQFGGLAIMPFAILVQSEYATDYPLIASLGAGLAFLLAGIGVHMTQTAGLSLTNDLAPDDKVARVVGLMYIMLLIGMVIAAGTFWYFLSDYSHYRLIQVIQGAAVATWALNIIALWKQEPRDPSRTRVDRPRPSFASAWQSFSEMGPVARLLVVIGLGAAGFGMQDIIIEPYGARVLDLEVAGTTLLTGLWAVGMLVGFSVCGALLDKGSNPYRVIAAGALIGVVAFAMVIASAPLESPMLFRMGNFVIGLGAGLFYVGTLVATMELAPPEKSGFAIGAWGAVQATALGAALATGAGLSDLISALGAAGMLGEIFTHPAAGYSVVYSLEIVLLVAMVVAAWPLARIDRNQSGSSTSSSRFGLADNG
ncbi:BCD family MFS transporter [Halorhodospira halochloris]|uniref:BCD family MFS transporter n=1 Tax=Halorhodospira halochloris TaxID=1052 RepID=UPI001EE8D489|nr:BCD family MFS transporter [Halorhodospira halochloris]MCG5548067.1 BCD family MFS transporter [Halorhodospira halochloris]